MTITIHQATETVLDFAECTPPADIRSELKRLAMNWHKQVTKRTTSDETSQTCFPFTHLSDWNVLTHTLDANQKTKITQYRTETYLLLIEGQLDVNIFQLDRNGYVYPCSTLSLIPMQLCTISRGTIWQLSNVQSPPATLFYAEQHENHQPQRYRQYIDVLDYVI